MKLPWARKEENRIKNVQAVRVETRQHLDMELGDIEKNKRRAEALRKKAQGDG